MESLTERMRLVLDCHQAYVKLTLKMFGRMCELSGGGSTLMNPKKASLGVTGEIYRTPLFTLSLSLSDQQIPSKKQGKEKKLGVLSLFQLLLRVREKVNRIKRFLSGDMFENSIQT